MFSTVRCLSACNRVEWRCSLIERSSGSPATEEVLEQLATVAVIRIRQLNPPEHESHAQRMLLGSPPGHRGNEGPTAVAAQRRVARTWCGYAAGFLAGPRVDVLPEYPASFVHAVDRHHGRNSVAEGVE